MSARHNARMLARYNAWANKLLFQAVAALPPGEATKPRRTRFKNMVSTLNHNFVIDQIFQAHLEGREHGFTARNTPTYPPLEDLWRAQQALDAWYIQWSDASTDSSLAERVSFTFVGGGEGVMTREQILIHLVTHTTYHRGWIVEMFNQVPADPPTTDLPVFLRDVSPELS